METIANDSNPELSDKQLTDTDRLERYKMEIQLYDKTYKTWEKRATKIIKRYKDERGESQVNPTRFNILYSNVQTLFPAAYGRDPKPDIRRRFKDDDVLGRVTADVLERCTQFSVNDKFSTTVKHCLQDRLLPGRGVSWVRYEPHFRDAAMPGAETDGQITEDVYEDAEKPLQEVYYEEVCHDYVYWKDFFHNVARTWEEVYLGGRRVYMTKDEIEERFGAKIAKLCPMDYAPRNLSEEKKDEVLKKSTIYELWDKNRQKVVWLHKDVEQFLDVKDDPLGLPDFFPFPRPLFAVLTNDSLVPVPDYIEYQDQANELDELTSRISSITKSLKVVGVYDASAPGIAKMLNDGVENKLIPVEAWAVFGEKGGLSKAVEFMPIKEIAEVLTILYESREKVKNDLYEITGIADIIRGATKASETATAQNIKSQFATLRLDSIQHQVAFFAKHMVINTALIIAKHFSLDTIKAISGVQLLMAQEKQQIQMVQQQYQQTAQQAQATGQQPPPPPPMDEHLQEMLENPTWEEVYALLQDQPHLAFKIDIETDSTIKQDEQEDKQARMEFLTAAGTFIQQAAQIENPMLMPLFIEMLMFGIRGFPIGKSIEGTFRTILQKVEKQAQQPQPPKPDPAMAKIEADKEMEANRLAADKEKTAMQMQADKEKTGLDMQADAQKNAAKIQSDEKQAQMNAAVEITKHEKTLSSQKDIAAMTNEANSKPTTQVQISGEDAIQEAADALKSMAQDNTALITAAVQTLQQTQQESTKVLAAIMQSLNAPKHITLDNGRTATVT